MQFYVNDFSGAVLNLLESSRFCLFKFSFIANLIMLFPQSKTTNLLPIYYLYYYYYYHCCCCCCCCCYCYCYCYCYYKIV